MVEGALFFSTKSHLRKLATSCGRCCRKVGGALALTEVSTLELFAPVAFDSAGGTGVVEYPAAQSLAGLQDIGGERRRRGLHERLAVYRGKIKIVHLKFVTEMRTTFNKEQEGDQK